uniref:Uncharacterized protein n=1 Tax=Caenorhabditis tropicalis TaxID=1561998 RepID=A0A1I7TRW4_9PELO
MAEPTSSNAMQSSSSSSESSAPSSPCEESVEFEILCEERLYDFACMARAKGLFSKVPPCHRKARIVVHEIAKFLDLDNRGFQNDPDYSVVYSVIRDLPNVKADKLHTKPGYSHIMGVLKEEFNNYSMLALQRGFKERGEIFQLIAHFPRVGLYLRRINTTRPYRYEGVTQTLEGCTHQHKEQRYILNDYEKAVLIDVPPSEPRKCAKCEERICQRALANLQIMARKMDEEPTDFSIDATINPFNFEKSFKIPKHLILNQPNTEYASLIDNMRGIWNCDIESVRLRERMFKNRLRQQKLTAMVNIYHEKSYGEQLDEVVKDINSIAEKVQEEDVKTNDFLLALKAGFQGNWEMIRKGLGTTTGLSSYERKIGRLQLKVEDLEASNAKLRRLYEAEKAKNRGEEASPNKQAKYSKDDKDRDDRKDRKDTLKRGFDDSKPSTSGYVPKRFRN